MLKELLEKNGIRQATFARAAGISSGMLNRVCNGKVAPASTTQYRIVNKLAEMSGNKYTLSDVFPANAKKTK